MPHTAQARHARPRYPGHGRMRRASRVRRRARQAAVRCFLGADTSQIATFAATRVLTVRYGDRRGGTAGARRGVAATPVRRPTQRGASLCTRDPIIAPQYMMAAASRASGSARAAA